MSDGHVSLSLCTMIDRGPVVGPEIHVAISSRIPILSLSHLPFKQGSSNQISPACGLAKFEGQNEKTPGRKAERDERSVRTEGISAIVGVPRGLG